jgi:hypothetical protein
MKPSLVANVRLYAAADGGKQMPALPGWGCPCFTTKGRETGGWDGWMVLDAPLQPGESRDGVPFVFLRAEGGEVMRSAGHFYLWELRFLGEATVVG